MSDTGVPVNQPVHLGVWTNWSHGRVLGSTLTLTQRNGTLLVAFIALFVAFVGASLFRLACFIFHQSLSTDTAQDALYHQRQALLRNAESGTGALWRFVQLLWSWRRKGRRPFRRLLPLLAYIALSISAIFAAGIFSSRIVSMTGDEVLIRSPHCGLLEPPENATEAELTDYTVLGPYELQRMNVFSEYAQDCYSASGSTDNQACSSYVKTRLPSHINRTAECPFKNNTCQSNNGSIKIDTGLLDSHSDLGINAPPSQRILFRRILHCSPLVTENYTDTVNFTSPFFSAPYRRYYYGGREVNGVFGKSTYVHTDNLMSLELTRAQGDTSDIPAYGLTKATAYTWNSSLYIDASEFKPIEALSREDADVMVVFLSANNILFSAQVDDPWYSAHQDIAPLHHSNGTTAYLADNPAVALGCTMQYQTCLPSSNGTGACSPLGGMYDLYNHFAGQTPEQFDTAQWISAAAITAHTIEVPILNLGPAALNSKYTLSKGVQAPLPNNQWQIDVEGLSNISLATIQGAAVDTATGPHDPRMYDWFRPPSDKTETRLCHSQKIRSTAYANFSVFGLSFTFGIGALIILAHYTAEWLTERIQQRRGSARKLYANLEWRSNNILQLQRLAHEELGLGTWVSCDGDVPMTEKDELLGVLDVGDPRHPVLMAAGGATGTRVDRSVEGKPEPIIRYGEILIGEEGDSPQGTLHDRVSVEV